MLSRKMVMGNSIPRCFYDLSMNVDPWPAHVTVFHPDNFALHQLIHHLGMNSLNVDYQKFAMHD